MTNKKLKKKNEKLNKNNKNLIKQKQQPQQHNNNMNNISNMNDIIEEKEEKEEEQQLQLEQLQDNIYKGIEYEQELNNINNQLEQEQEQIQEEEQQDINNHNLEHINQIEQEQKQIVEQVQEDNNNNNNEEINYYNNDNINESTNYDDIHNKINEMIKISDIENTNQFDSVSSSSSSIIIQSPITQISSSLSSSSSPSPSPSIISKSSSPSVTKRSQTPTTRIKKPLGDTYLTPNNQKNIKKISKSSSTTSINSTSSPSISNSPSIISSSPIISSTITSTVTSVQLSPRDLNLFYNSTPSPNSKNSSPNQITSLAIPSPTSPIATNLFSSNTSSPPLSTRSRTPTSSLRSNNINSAISPLTEKNINKMNKEREKEKQKEEKIKLTATSTTITNTKRSSSAPRLISKTNTIKETKEIKVTSPSSNGKMVRSSSAIKSSMKKKEIEQEKIIEDKKLNSPKRSKSPNKLTVTPTKEELRKEEIKKLEEELASSPSINLRQSIELRKLIEKQQKEDNITFKPIIYTRPKTPQKKHIDNSPNKEINSSESTEVNRFDKLYDDAVHRYVQHKIKSNEIHQENTFTPTLVTKASSRPSSRSKRYQAFDSSASVTSSTTVFTTETMNRLAARPSTPSKLIPPDNAELTFKPVITKRAQSIGRNRQSKEVVDRLYENGLFVKEKIEEKRIELSKKEMENCTFAPSLNSTKSFNSGLKQKDETFESFVDRLYNKEEAKKKKISALKQAKIESEVEGLTFQPTLYKSTTFTAPTPTKNVYDRLSEVQEKTYSPVVHEALSNNTFKPQINKRPPTPSRQAAAENSESVHERLFHQGVQKIKETEQINQIKKEEYELAETTFKPTLFTKSYQSPQKIIHEIDQDSPANDKHENIFERLSVKEDKEKKYKQIKEESYNHLTFTPQLCNKTREIASKKEEKLSLVDRLLLCDQRTKENISKKQKEKYDNELNDVTFKPKLNKKSINIVKEKNIYPNSTENNNKDFVFSRLNNTETASFVHSKYKGDILNKTILGETSSSYSATSSPTKSILKNSKKQEKVLKQEREEELDESIDYSQYNDEFNKLNDHIQANYDNNSIIKTPQTPYQVPTSPPSYSAVSNPTPSPSYSPPINNLVSTTPISPNNFDAPPTYSPSTNNLVSSPTSSSLPATTSPLSSHTPNSIASFSSPKTFVSTPNSTSTNHLPSPPSYSPSNQNEQSNIDEERKNRSNSFSSSSVSSALPSSTSSTPLSSIHSTPASSPVLKIKKEFTPLPTSNTNSSPSFTQFKRFDTKKDNNIKYTPPSVPLNEDSDATLDILSIAIPPTTASSSSISTTTTSSDTTATATTDSKKNNNNLLSRTISMDKEEARKALTALESRPFDFNNSNKNNKIEIDEQIPNIFSSFTNPPSGNTNSDNYMDINDKINSILGQFK